MNYSSSKIWLTTPRTRLDIPILLFFCLLVEIASLLFYEARWGYDTAWYMGYSSEMMAKKAIFFKPHYFWYIGYAVFITLARAIWDHVFMIVLLQLGFHVLGVAALYKGALLVLRDRLAAWISALCFMLWPDVLFWNHLIMTESFCASFTSIVLYLLIRQIQNKSSLLHLFPVVCILFLVRPTGIAFLAAYLVCVLFYYRSYLIKYQYVAVGLGILGIFGGYILLNQMLKTYVLLESYAIGEVVYHAATLPLNYPGRDQIILQVPPDLFMPSVAYPSIVRVALFAINNPLYFLKLAGTKTVLFLTHTKPYYSFIHNALLVMVLFPMYGAIIHFVVKKDGWLAWKSFVVTYILLHTIIVALTIEDWDGRFLMPVFPLLFLLGGKSFAEILRLLKSSLGLTKGKKQRDRLPIAE